MTAIKTAIEKLKVIDELITKLDDIYRSADDQREYIRNSIDEEVHTAYPDYAVGSPEYQRACEQSWRWIDLEETHARMEAAQALKKDLEKLAGIK